MLYLNYLNELFAISCYLLLVKGLLKIDISKDHYELQNVSISTFNGRPIIIQWPSGLSFSFV